MDSYGRSRKLRGKPSASSAAEPEVKKRSEPPAIDPLTAIKKQFKALQAESASISTSSASAAVEPEVKKRSTAISSSSASSEMDELLELGHLDQLKRRFEASKNKLENSESS